MEVFLIAGQSNAANEGEVLGVPSEAGVFSYDPLSAHWVVARDPQPWATGVRGSPWPVFGSRLVHDLDAPVGLVSVAFSGSSVGEWQPSALKHYARLREAVRALGAYKIRAVLWHQGEADVQLGTTAEQYQLRLAEVIDQLNKDAGYAIPWVVAEASFVNYPVVGELERSRMAAVHRGQELLWQSGKALRGPSTDDLTGALWRWDGIHLNAAGLKLHGERWAAVVEKTLFSKPSK